MVQDRAQ